MNIFAKQLKGLRLERNISQQKLSSYLGYGYTAISNYESGRNEPSIDTIIKIACFFDVTIDYLFGISENPKRVEGVSRQEADLLCDYRNLSEKDRKIVFEIAKALCQK